MQYSVMYCYGFLQGFIFIGCADVLLWALNSRNSTLKGTAAPFFSSI